MSNLILPIGKNIVYKIRRNSDGQFSMGGSFPRFNKTGKIWKQRGHLTSHINQLWEGTNISGTATAHAHGKRHVYEDCEIIPYEISETELGTTQTIMSYIVERQRERQERERVESLRRGEVAERERRTQYEELKKEFE